MSNPTRTVQDMLRSLTPQDFASLGANEIAYVRPVRVQNMKGWGLFAADGTQLSVHANLSQAVANAMQNDLECVAVQ